jgi:hypothetical protein
LAVCDGGELSIASSLCLTRLLLSPSFGVRVLASPDGLRYVDIGVDLDTELVYVSFFFLRNGVMHSTFTLLLRLLFFFLFLPFSFPFLSSFSFHCGSSLSLSLKNFFFFFFFFILRSCI